MTMAQILRSLRGRGSALDYRIRICLFVSLFALSLTSASLQIAYGLPFVRSLFTGGGEYSDIDIFELDLLYNRYVGVKFKTRGIFHYLSEDQFYLQSYLASNNVIWFNNRFNPSPPSGSFIEVKGEVLREQHWPYRSYIVINSWEYSSVSYEVLIDFLTASTVACTFILLLGSTQVIGASIAFRTYEKRKLARETVSGLKP